MMMEKVGSCSLPCDIIFEILRELPVKTLLRFRAVSKLWCSIIDDPVFIDSHRTRSHTRPGGIRILSHLSSFGNTKVYSSEPGGVSPVHILSLDSLDDYFYNSEHDDIDYVVLHCVNGLACWENSIYNPSTRESIRLLPITIDFQLNMGPYPCKFKVYPYYFLGFDSSKNAYKVLNKCRIFWPGQTARVEYRILNLGGPHLSYWRNLDSSVPDEFQNNRGFNIAHGLCCVNDVMFCIDWTVVDTDQSHFILAFEVGPEKFRVMSLPTGINRKHCHLVEIGQRLAVINVDPEELDINGTEFQVMIWVLEDYQNQKWEKRESFTFPKRWTLPNHGDIWIKADFTLPMCTVHTSEVVFYSISQSRSGHYFWCCFYYDVESKDWRLVTSLVEFPDERPFRRVVLAVLPLAKQVECLYRLKSLVA